ncbi:hypothetical protein DFH09DRAFT_436465 [Mycena vulgaris]|nr:hypothetical protein DFH09DRAFT_436465 [Mycena vulgaris]
MLFHDLNEHVLAEILARCDIYTVLSFTRVNKYCRHLALAHKQLWISLIRDLECRGLLDLPPAANMQEYTTVDLIDEVKRVVQGPKTWSPAYPSPPVLQRETIVRFEQPRGGNRTSFSVLPGGRYFALTDRWTALEVWELATGRCVWTHPHSISCWSFDMVDGGDVAFMVCHVHNPSYNAAIEVIRLDLHTGQSSDIIRIPLPGMRNSSLATLRGDFFAISLNIQLPSAQLLIVNWRAETYALLRFPPFFMVNFFDGFQLLLIRLHLSDTSCDSARPCSHHVRRTPRPTSATARGLRL